MTNDNSNNNDPQNPVTPDQLSPEEKKSKLRARIVIASIFVISLGFYLNSLLGKAESENLHQKENQAVEEFVDSVTNHMYIRREAEIIDSLISTMSLAAIDSMDAYIRENLDCDCPSIKNSQDFNTAISEKFPDGIPDSIFNNPIINH